MKKNLKIICIVILCLELFTINVFAHPGKTDSNGGHYNHSTGEYHYHHGYSAHSHYDMDGDGMIDCPYDFNDKTNHNSGSNNSSNNTDSNTSTSKYKTEKLENKITFKKAVGIVFFAMPLLLLLTFYVLYIVVGILHIIIVRCVEKFFKVSIEESIQNRIFRVLLTILCIILVPLEILCLFGII